MKQLFFIAFVTSIIVAACKTKKSTTTSADNSINYDAQLAGIKDKFPDATVEELKAGNAIYSGACTRCHGKKDVTKYTDEKLIQVIDNMSKKAKITDQEKQSLVKFAYGVRAVSASK